MTTIEVGSTIAGYRIEAQIGRGGMGVVYLAEEPQLGRHVAIKVIAPEYASDEAFRRRFERESRLAASIEHPNAVPVYQAGDEEGTLFLVMRYVPGTDLRALLEDVGALEPARAANIVAQIAGALDEAHCRGLVHRDVKPANILIASHRGRDHAYLTDFGLTKQASGDPALTQTGQWVGTIDYAAPEQLDGSRVDARADVYALGCVLFQALTGRVPFDKDSDVAKLAAHLKEPPPRASDQVSELPGEVDAIIARALEKELDERFPSAGDLGRAIIAACEDRPIDAPERVVASGPAAPADGSGAVGSLTPGEALDLGHPYLVYRDGGGHERALSLPASPDRLTIGRGDGATIVLGWDEAVSRLHAELHRVGDDWMLVDDGLSHNGSFVNGDRVSGRRRLRDGDDLRLGNTTIAFFAPLGGDATQSAIYRPPDRPS